MCGIAGQLQFGGRSERTDAIAAVRSMASALLTRGPDDEGVWSDPAAGIALSFRRLAILDLSPMGHQPMVSASGRYALVFNGEIYNHAGLRDELSRRGHSFRGRSDTEVLLAECEEHGFEAALSRLRGMFAIALWDAQDRALYLARDRMGEKPLCYGWARPGELLCFGSTTAALRAHPAFTPRVDRASLMRYIRHGSVPSPSSIYQGVWKLPAGSWIRIASTSDVEQPPRTYYSIRSIAEHGLAEPLEIDREEARARLDAELRRAVREQMVADVPLGAFLSGGIDSSTVVALMQAQSDQPVRTFSIGFHQQDYDESPYARAVANHLGTDHTEFYVSAAEALEAIPRIPFIYDEPFADSSQIPTYLVSQLARRHVTVALTGDGGDELFAGYPRYESLRKLVWPFAIPGRRRIANGLHHLVELATRDGVETSLTQNLVDWARRRTDVARTADLDHFYQLYMSLWYHPEWLMPSVEEPMGVMPLSKHILSDGNATERAMLADLMHNLPDDLLVKVDRAAMAVSLETRLPLLDPGVVALSWRLPFHLKVHGAVGKVVLRDVLARYVPRQLFERPKMGFMVPIVDWLRGPLRGWAETLLDERRLREGGFLEPRIIRRRWNSFQAGIRDWHGLLWGVLMWQAWLEANPST